MTDIDQRELAMAEAIIAEHEKERPWPEAGDGQLELVMAICRRIVSLEDRMEAVMRTLLART